MRIVIAGAGISGCIAAWVMCKAGHKVTMFCPSGIPGGETRNGPWRMRPDSDAMREMLDDLEVTYFDADKPHGAVAMFPGTSGPEPKSHLSDRPFYAYEATDTLPDELYDLQAAKVWPTPAAAAANSLTVFGAPEMMKPRWKHLDFNPEGFFEVFDGTVKCGSLLRVDQDATGKITIVFRTDTDPRIPVVCDAFIFAAPWDRLPTSFRREFGPQWGTGSDLWHVTTGAQHTAQEAEEGWFWVANDFVITPDRLNVLRCSHSKTGAWVEAVSGSSAEEIESDLLPLLGSCKATYVRRIHGIPQGATPTDLPQWMLAIGPNALASELETPDITLARCNAFARKITR